MAGAARGSGQVRKEMAMDETDVASAVAFLASDGARHITGLQLTVDAGMSIR